MIYAAVVLTLCVQTGAEGVIPYENYTYSESDQSIVPGPQAYVPTAAHIYSGYRKQPGSCA